METLVALGSLDFQFLKAIFFSFFFLFKVGERDKEWKHEKWTYVFPNPFDIAAQGQSAAAEKNHRSVPG